MRMQPSVPIQCDAAVLHQERVGPGVYWLVLGVDAAFPAPVPGQFVFLKVSEGWEPFLRRPMSVFAFRRTRARSELEILYRVVGRGTALLARRRAGDGIDTLGPLGNGFRAGEGLARILVAGGMGVAPLVFLASSLGAEDILILGCRSASEFPVEFVVERTPESTRVVTEDGSCGRSGLASDVAGDVAEERRGDIEFLAAGPSAMLAAVARLARARGARCQVCVEARMACGVGACNGCVVPTVGAAYRRACKEGPVFEAEEIRWDALL